MGIEWGIGSGEGVEMRRRATPDAAPQGIAVGVWRCRIACSNSSIDSSGCRNAGFRQGFPVARAWAEELGRDLGDCVLMAS